MSNPPSPLEFEEHQRNLARTFKFRTPGASDDDAANECAAYLASQVAIVTTPGEPGYRGEYDCGDCCSMSHCETHGKEPGTYPFDEAAAEAGLPHPFQRPE